VITAAMIAYCVAACGLVALVGYFAYRRNVRDLEAATRQAIAELRSVAESDKPLAPRIKRRNRSKVSGFLCETEPLPRPSPATGSESRPESVDEPRLQPDADHHPKGKWTNIVPLNDKIVVERLEADEKIAGGIILPDTAEEKPKQGKILSVGEGRLLDDGRRATLRVKVGDRVLFGSYAGTEVYVDGKEYVLMTEDDVLAVVDLLGTVRRVAKD